ncbi:hypothetical protein NAEGRDRAFT_57776 [Naegleria gruberi]|uniref:Uncharacterized protein n=1 Tax=Naegleria gruberi TaxID=5762 RepID=D2VC87_NAEGR|nr:uncharacterized protein NAEGRDRAFT_57776 [Naegleria gruberi]EFC45706.1 hypothetical protein NAEGRDRAFT_57776 [Naegleria gruberi]|eukprot:XP_002678450.1 hypothetical protein NAEGRDRAFT_57776 [Naegleria gruberi strain NEG-M]
MGQTLAYPVMIQTILDGCNFLSTSFKQVDLKKTFLEYGEQCNALSIFVKEANKHISEFSPTLKERYKSLKVKLYEECMKLTNLNTTFRTTLNLMKKELEYFRVLAKTDETALLFTNKIASHETTFNEMAKSFEKYKDDLGTMGSECVDIAQQIDNEIPKEKFGKARAWTIVGIITGCVLVVGGVAAIIAGVISCFIAPALAPVLIGGGIAATGVGIGTIVPSGSTLSKINNLQNGTNHVAARVSETAKCLSDIIAQCKFLATSSASVSAENKWVALRATIDTLMILIKSSVKSSTQLDDSIKKLRDTILK